MMRKMAVEPIFAVACKIMDAGVVAAINMVFSTLLNALTFFDCKVLLGAQAADPVELSFELLVLEKVFVEHHNYIIFLSANK